MEDNWQFFSDLIDTIAWERDFKRSFPIAIRRNAIINSLNDLMDHGYKDFLPAVIDDLISRYGIDKAEFIVLEDLLKECQVDTCWGIFTWWLENTESVEF